ncbi:hypothetical protein [Henriciella sp.]|uniref:hypothetical protein n=1 Tax=Henriciella sp. TaxID=1968823 RepID=UPI00260B6A7B|nr:hypothetical protein [Henriciella sp.]
MRVYSKMLIGAALFAALPFAAQADGEKGTWDKDAVNQRYQAVGADSSDRILTEEQVDDIIRRSGTQGPAGVRYLGGPEAAVDSELCCETVEEQVTEKTEVEETTTYFDAVTKRNIIQPVERTITQPIDRRILRPRSETVTNETRYEEERLPKRVETLPAPPVQEKIIPQVTEKTVLEVQDEYVDQVTRNIIQPVVITTVQPVERRILRPQTETVTNKTRYEEERLPVRVEKDTVPPVKETVTEDVTVEKVEETSETYYDAVTRREVIQPIERTTVVPVKRRILRPVTETVVNDTRYETRRAPVRVEEDTVPPVMETVTEEVNEVYRDEVNETYFDAVTEREIIQPVVRRLIQPVEYRKPNPVTETITAPTRYETQRASLVVLTVGEGCDCR